MDHGADREDARRGQAAAPGRAARPGLLQAAGLDRAADLAGRLVLVPDRRQPRQAQHLRLPHARPARPISAKLSSVEIRPPRRSIRLGKYRIPLGKADVRLLRKSQPFWNILGEHGIFSCILRVPITFPAREAARACCSRPCASPTCAARRGCSPTTRPAPRRGREDRRRGPSRHPRGRHDPRRPDRPAEPVPRRTPADLRLPFAVTIKGQDRAVLKIDGAKYELREGRVHRLDPGSASASRRA